MYPVFNAYPTLSQPMLSQPTPQTPPAIQYVNGKTSAEAYQLPANSSVLLMDSSECKFYIKQTDASGMATVKTYKFEEVRDDTVNPEYITRSEFESFKSELKHTEEHSL